MNNALDAARAAIDQSTGVLVTAGAGMGVDSGLPDFRGNEGFWKAYPALKTAGIDFSTIASYAAFEEDPEQAWGFYGHRLKLYRETVPHEGYALLKTLFDSKPQGGFVVTSNVDEQFQKAGFKQSHIYECHGSIHTMQCMGWSCNATWRASNGVQAFHPEIEPKTGLLANELPRCVSCGKLARPNIHLFFDQNWQDDAAQAENRKLERWLGTVEKLVVIELGAGTTIKTIRQKSESVSLTKKCPLIRINPQDATIPKRRGSQGYELAMGALQGLRALLI